MIVAEMKYSLPSMTMCCSKWQTHVEYLVSIDLGYWIRTNKHMVPNSSLLNWTWGDLFHMCWRVYCKGYCYEVGGKSKVLNWRIVWNTCKLSLLFFSCSFEIRYGSCRRNVSMFLLWHRFPVYTLGEKIVYMDSWSSILSVFILLLIQQSLGWALGQQKWLAWGL